MKTNKIILSLVMGTLLTTSCVNDFLELQPLDSQTEAIYFKNLTQFQYAANNLHTNIYACCRHVIQMLYVRKIH